MGVSLAEPDAQRLCHANFFSRRGDFPPRQVIELGISDGGSTVFWFELFKPPKHVALDIQAK